jgi:hypothetical protein
VALNVPAKDPQLVRLYGWRHSGFVTWDEDDGSSGNHVATLVISPYTPPGATDGASLSHYSLLRTTEDMLGLGCLANSCSPSDFRSAFGL